MPPSPALQRSEPPAPARGPERFSGISWVVLRILRNGGRAGRIPVPRSTHRIAFLIGLPERTEAPPYYFRYIDRISNGDVVEELENQLDEAVDLFSGISEEKSLHRYAPEKWSVRQVLNHAANTERVFLFRAFWFAR